MSRSQMGKDGICVHDQVALWCVIQVALRRKVLGEDFRLEARASRFQGVQNEL
jgi:hypothetical protein